MPSSRFHLACSECERRAVSVCNFKTNGIVQFSGCGHPFCERHGVPHKLSRRSCQNNFELDLTVVKEKRKEINQGDSLILHWLAKEDPEAFRCCQECWLEWNLKVVQAKQAVSFVALLIFLVIASILLLEVMDRFFTPPLCAENTIFSRVIGNCFKKSNKAKNELGYANFRTLGQCKQADEIKGKKVFICKCPQYFYHDYEDDACKQEHCQSLQWTGRCLSMNSVKLQKEHSTKGRCPLYRRYSSIDKTCLQMKCPRNFEVLEDGSCRQCPPYATSFSQKCRPFSDGFILPTMSISPRGSSRECSTSLEGELFSFLDALGNLQCSISEGEKPDSEGRPCLPHEVLRKDQIACSFSCPPNEHFDFGVQKCLKPICRLNEVLLSSGDCYRCPLYFLSKQTQLEPIEGIIRSSTTLDHQSRYFEGVQKCLEQQSQEWPDAPVISP